MTEILTGEGKLYLLYTFAHVAEQHGLHAALYLKATAGRGQRWWLTPV